MTCKCENVLEAFGQTKCVSLFGAVKGIIFTDQTLNTSTIDANFASSLPYFLKTLRNVSVDVSDPQFQEFEDGYRVFIRDGTITFTALVPQSTFERICRVKQLQCFTEVDAYLVDKSGKVLTGRRELDRNGNFVFFPVKLSAFVAKPIFASDTQVQSMEIKFNLETPVCDLHLLTPDINIMDYDALIPLVANVVKTPPPYRIAIQIGFSEFYGDPLPTILVGAPVAGVAGIFDIRVNNSPVVSGVTLDALIGQAGRELSFSPALNPGDIVEIRSGTNLIQLGYYIADTKITV